MSAPCSYTEYAFNKFLRYWWPITARTMGAAAKQEAKRRDYFKQMVISGAYASESWHVNDGKNTISVNIWTFTMRHGKHVGKMVHLIVSNSCVQVVLPPPSAEIK